MTRGRMVAVAGISSVALLGVALAVRRAHRPLTAAPLVVTQAYQQLTDTLRRDETFGDVLAREGVTGRAYVALLGAAHQLDPRRMRPGLAFHFRRTVGDSIPDQLMVRLAPETRVWLVREGAVWTERVEAIAWTPVQVRVTGKITNTLYDALDGVVPDSVLPAAQRVVLAWAIADVYDWEVDFTRDVRPGDRFDVLFELLRSTDGERRVGRILAARVDVAKNPNYAFRFAGADSTDAGYYDEQGRSLRRAFLRAPLQFRRI